MSYQVLARKWRPRKFAELVGQSHIVQPLANALATGRLHHALLFTGTRGVGKTTLARLFAKALNCEQGVSAEPCGECSACQAIEQGRFVDLIEIDAASRTKVEDTRDLLDNVQYAPSQGRYKVYLIDEVHMLSRHSFNALLKTLEEPPLHVKFILATTDPQRLPVTILSRCLQFNLKRLPERLIAERLRWILEQEGIDHETLAIEQLARAGDGSLRDALTLLDQAIAFSAGRVATEDVNQMLGTIDPRLAVTLLEALAARDAEAVLRRVAELDERVPDYVQLLGELLIRLQRIAVLQIAPGVREQADDDGESLQQLARMLSPEQVQLYYQIALLGRRDLPLAPDARGGFEMILLRMLCFAPVTEMAAEPSVAPQPAEPAPGVLTPGASTPSTATPRAPARSTNVIPHPAAGSPEPPPAAPLDPTGDWSQLVGRLRLSGLASQLARHCVVREWQDNRLTLCLAEAHKGLGTDRLTEQLRAAIAQRLGQDVKLRVIIGRSEQPTLAQQDAEQRRERQRGAEQLIDNDPNVQALQKTFNARVRPESVQPWTDETEQTPAPDSER